MPSPIKNVILIGAGGNLGPAVLKEFLAAGKSFKITMLARTESKSTFPPEIKVIKADYSSKSALKDAFTGQDAVVSIVGPEGYAEQQKIVDAAVEAGVKRFIPSEFGFDTASSTILQAVPGLAAKRAVVKYLISKESSGISWTAVSTGVFFDWGLKVGFAGFDIAQRKATLWDDGAARWYGTNVATIGKALVAILSDRAYEKTKNQYVYTASHQDVTQKEILASLEKQTGQKWEIGTEDAQKRADEAKGKQDFGAFYSLIQAAFLGKKELARVPKLWNEELGLPEESLDESVKAVLEGKV